jgi:hypothetical protein
MLLRMNELCSLFGWLVADGWCGFVLREKYCWLVAGGWFVVREKYCWLVADKPSEQAVDPDRSMNDIRLMIHCCWGHEQLNSTQANQKTPWRLLQHVTSANIKPLMLRK